MLASTAIDGGFSNPVLQAQQTFRVLMDAMARPASIIPLEPLVEPPAPLLSTAAQLACTLLDADTGVWLDPVLNKEPVCQWLTFQTGAPVCDAVGESQFALIGNVSTMPALELFAQGSQEFPDRSTTLILQLPSLQDGEPLHFTGPGIERLATIAPQGLPAHFCDQWAANRARFPRGVDLVLAAPEAIVCLPRTAQLVSGEG